MGKADSVQVCRYCGVTGAGSYCSNCGESFLVKKLSLPSLVHDIFHFFTHLDKGLGFTLRELLTGPGKMQRLYIDGYRARHQKPFSTFFISFTLVAVIRYWVLKLLDTNSPEGLGEANFFHEYFAIMHLFLMPLYVGLTWLIFKRKYNYAETGVFILYHTAMFCLLTGVIFLFKLIWPGLDTAYVEAPVLLLYNMIACVNFFNNMPRWEVIIRSTLLFFCIFALAQATENILIKVINGL